MAISQEVQNWIEQMKAAGATPEWIASTTALVEGNEKLATSVRETVLAQSDYTRQTQSLKALEKQQKDELQKSIDHQARLTKWQQDETAKGQEAVKAREAAETALAHTRARLKSLKDQGYVDDKMLEGIDLTPPNPNPPPNPPAGGGGNGNGDAAKYLTADQFNTGARNLVEINDEIALLRAEHERIFAGVADAPKFDRKKILDYVADKNNPAVEGSTPAARIRNVWQAVYPVQERQHAMQEADIQARIKAGAEDLYTKRVSSEIQAGHHVAVNTEPSVMRKIASTPLKDVPANAAIKRHERINKAVAELTTARA